MDNNSKLKAVHTSFSNSEIILAKSYLKSEGIKSYVLEDSVSTVIPSTTILTQGIILAVEEKDFPLAKKLLSKLK